MSGYDYSDRDECIDAEIEAQEYLSQEDAYHYANKYDDDECQLIEAGNSVLSSLNLFETVDQADESSKIVAKWITDENLSTAIPNAPKITTGKVVAHSNGVAAVA